MFPGLSVMSRTWLGNKWCFDYFDLVAWLGNNVHWFVHIHAENMAGQQFFLVCLPLCRKHG